MKLIGVSLRYFKCYESTELIPLFFEEGNFTGLIGENGVGKSAVLEGLHSFFTGKKWIRNKTGKKGESTCGVAPIIMLPESEITAKLFSDDEMKTVKNYSRLIQKNFNNKANTNFSASNIFLSCGYFEDGSVKLFDGASFALTSNEDNLAGKIRSLILSSFKYIYINAEIDIDSSASLNSGIAEFIKGSGIVGEITNKLREIKVKDGSGEKGIAHLINTRVLKYLDEEVIKKLKEIDPSYNYKNLQAGKISSLTERQISELATQALFNSRELTKRIKTKDIGISDMSSGQRRRVFLDFILVMIGNLDKAEREKIILAIDEPEISVDASSRIQQFEKLRNLEETGPSIVFTTHWYGWIAQLISGGTILIKETEAGRTISPSSIENFFSDNMQIKVPYEMRMMFDFLSSLGTWAENESSKRFVICEGRTDFNYISKHFPDYKIIPSRGYDEVVRLYMIFSEYYLRVRKWPKNVAFLIDTEPEKLADIGEIKNENLKRISRDSSGRIQIVSRKENGIEKCVIEDLLPSAPLLAALKKSTKILGAPEKEFINGIAVKYPNLTGVRSFGLDEVQRIQFNKIFKGEYKLSVSGFYTPNPEEQKVFQDLLTLFK